MYRVSLGAPRNCSNPARRRADVPRLIDAASIRMAENLLAKLEQIEAHQTLDVVEPAATG
jgi:hypothetical protein